MTPQQLLKHWQQIRAGLVATIDKYDDDMLDYLPVAGGYSVAQIMLHIAHEELIEVGYGILRSPDTMPDEFRPEDYLTVESIKDQLAQVHDQTETYLRPLPEDGLAQDAEMAWGDTMRIEDLVWHTLDHEIHHRGELSFILGLLGREGLDA